MRYYSLYSLIHMRFHSSHSFFPLNKIIYIFFSSYSFFIISYIYCISCKIWSLYIWVKCCIFLYLGLGLISSKVWILFVNSSLKDATMFKSMGVMCFLFIWIPFMDVCICHIAQMVLSCKKWLSYFWVFSCTKFM